MLPRSASEPEACSQGFWVRQKIHFPSKIKRFGVFEASFCAGVLLLGNAVKNAVFPTKLNDLALPKSASEAEACRWGLRSRQKSHFPSKIKRIAIWRFRGQLPSRLPPERPPEAVKYVIFPTKPSHLTLPKATSEPEAGGSALRSRQKSYFPAKIKRIEAGPKPVSESEAC